MTLKGVADEVKVGSVEEFQGQVRILTGMTHKRKTHDNDS